ncbi:MAG TPA: hypothetical protein VFB16_11325 [Bauldia sp.]|nr:hypothetical protein [Bauldia sp.]
MAVAAIYLLAIAGLFPAPSGGGTEQTMGALEKRIAALEGGNAGAAIDALASKVVALQTQVAALAAAPPPADPAAAVAPVAARVSRLEAALPAAGADLAGRLDALEAAVREMGGKVSELASRPWGANESERAARTVAIGTLRQAAEKGGAFVGDLAMLAALGSDPADVAALRPLAEKGAPSRAELQSSFGEVADAILRATRPAGAGSGLLDRLAGFARGLVSVKPTAPVEGTTPEAIVSRMVAEVERGDLAGALGERDALPDAGKAASAAWANAAETRLAIDRVIAKLSASVASPAGGG